MSFPTIEGVRAAWQKWAETKESPAGTNCTPFGEWYGFHCAAWCAMSLSYMYIHEAGGSFDYIGLGPKGTASVSVFEQSFQRAGLWTHSPQAGDIVIYGNGEHVEWVDSVVSAGIYTWGGNTGPSNASNGGEIHYQFRPFDSWITGFGRAKYSNTGSAPESTEGDEEMYVLACQNGVQNNRTAQYLLTGANVFNITDPNDLALLKNQGIKTVVVNPALFDRVASKAV